ncbi:hypothetical protein [Metaclostridioides mangenotii]|nr:hypothetical protein [Clostridioides mangenotii]
MRKYRFLSTDVIIDTRITGVQNLLKDTTVCLVLFANEGEK